jgi:hypothetical protein
LIRATAKNKAPKPLQWLRRTAEKIFYKPIIGQKWRKVNMLKAFKGFDKNLQCRGFQYEPGKSYEEPRANLCHGGFHACERPLDVFGYYPPATSRYAEVDLDGVTEQRDGDSKRVGTKITIGAEFSIPLLAKAHFEYVKSHTTFEHTDPKQATAGFKGAATAGDSGAATAGDSGAATAGNYGAATAGNYGAATAGDSGAATAGFKGAATAGFKGAATAGDSGAATSKGSVSVGENGVGLVRGNGIKAKGGIGAILVIAVENECDSDIKEWKAFVVDGEKIKANTWYTLRNDEIVEAD